MYTSLHLLASKFERVRVDKQELLTDAVLDGILPLVKKLVKSGVNCHGLHTMETNEDRERETYLHLAAARGRGDIIKFFIQEMGVNIHQRCARGYTPLHFAVLFGHCQAVKLLVKYGADCNAMTKEDETPCIMAARKGFKEILEILVKNGGANLNKSPATGISLFHAEAGRRGKDVHFLKRLIELGADYTARDIKGFSALFHAGFFGNVSAVKFLIEEKNLDPHDCNEAGDNLLHFLLSMNGNKQQKKDMHQVVEYLVNEGKVDLNRTAKDGLTPVQLACENRDLKTVKLLIEAGADYRGVCVNHGNSVLHRAAIFGKMDIVKYLAEELKLDVNGRNMAGETTLHFVCMPDDLDSVKLLLDYGADFNAVDKNGRCCLHYAAILGGTDVVKYLVEEKKMDVNLATKEGVTPLHTAADEGHLELCKLFVDLGADCESRDMKGDSVYDYAARKGNVDVVLYFLDKMGMHVNLCSSNEIGDTPLQAVSEASSSDGDSVNFFTEMDLTCSSDDDNDADNDNISACS